MSLKDALLKAGLKPTTSPNERVEKPKKQVKEIEVHQATRNFCEVCQLIQPDVERFAHRNPTIDADWICTRCADRAEIHDQFRRTHQSDAAKTKRYRREFGPTLIPTNNPVNTKSSEKSKEGNLKSEKGNGKNFNR